MHATGLDVPEVAPAGGDDSHTPWDLVHSGRPPEVQSWFEAEPTVSLTLIDRVRAGRTDGAGLTVLDVGAGASTLVDRLVAAGRDHVTVLDISPSALAHARRRLGATATTVEWVEADITRFRPRRTWDLWHDRALFHFLTEAPEREAYRASLSRALRPGGHAIIATFAENGPARCSGRDVVRYGSESLAAALSPGMKAIECQHVVHRTPLGSDQHFTVGLFRRG